MRSPLDPHEPRASLRPIVALVAVESEEAEDSAEGVSSEGNVSTGGRLSKAQNPLASNHSKNRSHLLMRRRPRVYFPLGDQRERSRESLDVEGHREDMFEWYQKRVAMETAGDE